MERRIVIAQAVNTPGGQAPGKGGLVGLGQVGPGASSQKPGAAVKRNMDQAHPQHGENGTQSAIQACHLSRLVKGGAELDVDYPTGREAGCAELEEIRLVQMGTGGVVGFGQIEEDQVKALPLLMGGSERVGGITKAQADPISVERTLGKLWQMLANHGHHVRIKFGHDDPIQPRMLEQLPCRGPITPSKHQGPAGVWMAESGDVHQAFVDHELVHLGDHGIAIQAI